MKKFKYFFLFGLIYLYSVKAETNNNEIFFQCPVYALVTTKAFIPDGNYLPFKIASAELTINNEVKWGAESNNTELLIDSGNTVYRNYYMVNVQGKKIFSDDPQSDSVTKLVCVGDVFVQTALTSAFNNGIFVLGAEGEIKLKRTVDYNFSSPQTCRHDKFTEHGVIGFHCHNSNNSKSSQKR